MIPMTRCAAGAIVLALTLTTSAWAQAPAAVRIRGAIQKIDGQTLSIKSREGQDMTVKLTPPATVTAIVKASLSDIKSGSFVGIAAVPDGKWGWRGLEVLIFPEVMRGTGEGDRPWDLVPESTMTNATVIDVVSKVEGHTLKLKYKDEEKTFVIPPETPIVTFSPGEASDLKVGAKVFVVGAVKQADGTFEASRINVGRGIDPPM